MTRVLVVGSINMDLVTETGVFPRLGETLFGQRFAQYPGGKGANQAVAAARLGAEVTMIGCVGDDVFGAALKDTLNREGVDTRWVRTAPTATGIATIMVCGGDNAIMLVPGANLALTPADLDQAEQAFRDADVVLAQLEVPLPTVEHAAELAHAHGKPFFLNPAPAVPLSAALLARIALLTPNQYELLTVLGMPADGASAADWRDALRATPGRIVMTTAATAPTMRTPTAPWRTAPACPSRPSIRRARATPSAARSPRSGRSGSTKPCAAPTRRPRCRSRARARRAACRR